MAVSWFEQHLVRRPRMANALHRFRVIEATSQTIEVELCMLAKYARGLRLALEIGSDQGISAARIASALSDDAILYCVDPWPNRSGRRNPSLKIFKRHTRRTRISHKLRVLHDVSQNIASGLPPIIDFIFVDGDHSADGIAFDWSLAKEKLKRGGIVCLHDVFVPPSEPWRRFASTDYFDAVIRSDPDSPW
jgi:predicted O-methyltransferase YrrM